MIYIFKQELSFEETCYSYLIRFSQNKEEVLQTLSQAALANYKIKSTLNDYYCKTFFNEKPFETYWVNFLNRHVGIAPDFSLRDSHNIPVTLSALQGQWVLIDFWATWCPGCREEHPALEQLYQQVTTKAAGKFAVITIACRSKENEVKAYIQKKHYTFPVVMADNQVEKNYNIEKLPSKFLITPQGRSILIPPGVDWEDYIWKFTGLKQE